MNVDPPGRLPLETVIPLPARPTDEFVANLSRCGEVPVYVDGKLVGSAAVAMHGEGAIRLTLDPAAEAAKQALARGAPAYASPRFVGGEAFASLAAAARRDRNRRKAARRARR